MLPGPINPLGKYATRIGNTSYGIHGTNRSSSVGRYVSRGCIRLYASDIGAFFNLVKLGTPIYIVDEPIKAGWIGNVLYVEVHPSRVRDTASFAKRRAEFDALVQHAAGDRSSRVDWSAAHRAFDEQTGVPVAIAE